MKCHILVDKQLADLLDEHTRKLAAVALGAYNAMETTKRRHFDYLSTLESKHKKFNLKATADETELLASLLQDHNQSVEYFKEQAQQLKSISPDAHSSMLMYIGRLNRLAGSSAAAPASTH